MSNGVLEGSRTDDGEVVELPGGVVRIRGHLDLIDQRLSDGTVAVRPVRLPRTARAHFPLKGEVLRAITENAAGVRLLFDTDAVGVRLHVRCTRLQFEDLPGPLNGFVAEVGGQDVAQVEAPVSAVLRLTFAGDRAEFTEIVPTSIVELTGLPAGPKTVTVWLPQGMIVDLVDIDADAPVRAPSSLPAPVWIHHGSSISHCVETPYPTGAWPVRASREVDLDLIDLGFGGQCMLDPFVADAIAATPADVISLKVGVNIVGARSMDQRTFGPALHGFLDRIRRGHPDTPIVVASSILWPGSEDTPGPADVEFFDDGHVRCYTGGAPGDVAKGALTMTESRRIIAEAVRERARTGEQTFYLDGLSLYGPQDAARFVLPDSLHPDTALYAEMADRFVAAVFADGGLVPRSSLSPARSTGDHGAIGRGIRVEA